MNAPRDCNRWKALSTALSSTVIAIRSLVRGLPLFFASRPKTPLRVLCIMAFDTLRRLRNGKPLPRAKIRTLAVLLDLGASANAAFDRKVYHRDDYRQTLQLLEDAEVGSIVDQYLQRLSGLESRRPSPGGDFRQFQEVRLYREAVVRLSLGALAAIANDGPCLNEEILATYRNADLDLLVRIAMQCQIIDDILDYHRDESAGLPSFLTASRPLSQAIQLTRRTASAYADDRAMPPSGELFPLRGALLLASTCTRLLIVLSRWRQRARFVQELAKRDCETRPLTADRIDASAFP